MITSTHRILDSNLGSIALHSKHFMIVVALVKRREPNARAKNENRDGIDEEQPVEYDERSLAPQGDENEGADKG